MWFPSVSRPPISRNPRKRWPPNWRLYTTRAGMWTDLGSKSANKKRANFLRRSEKVCLLCNRQIQKMLQIRVRWALPQLPLIASSPVFCQLNSQIACKITYSKRWDKVKLAVLNKKQVCKCWLLWAQWPKIWSDYDRVASRVTNKIWPSRRSCASWTKFRPME